MAFILFLGDIIQLETTNKNDTFSGYCESKIPCFGVSSASTVYQISSSIQLVEFCQAGGRTDLQIGRHTSGEKNLIDMYTEREIETLLVFVHDC